MSGGGARWKLAEWLVAALLACGGPLVGDSVETPGPLSIPNSKPSLLFLHGFTCDPSFWRVQIEFFKQDYQIYAPALPFHPGTQLEADPTVEGLADAIVAYIDENLGEAPVVIGHSLGGMVALWMALKSPDSVRAVVLADAFPSLAVSKRASLGLFGPDCGEEFREETQVRMRKNRNRMDPEACDRLWKSIDTMDVAPRLAEVKIPVYGIFGGRDRYRSDEGKRLAEDIELARIPRYSVRILEKTGHFVQFERPRDFNESLAEILGELRSPE